MLGEVLILGVKLRLVAMRLVYAALEIIGHDGAGDSTEALQSSHMAAQPIGQRLTPGRFGKGVITGAEHGNEDLRLAHLAGVCIGDAHGLTGVIDEQLVARPMLLAQHELLARAPLPVVLAERAVLPTVRVLRAVLFPQQQPRDATTLQLGVQLRKIRLRRARERHYAPIQPLVQRRLVQLCWQRPDDPRGSSATYALLHRRASTADRDPYLPVAVSLGLEPQNLANLAHG